MIKLLTPFILLLIASNSYPKSIIDRDFSEFIKNFPSIEKRIVKNLESGDLVTAYNVHSGKTKSVPKKAVENSPTLVSFTPTPIVFKDISQSSSISPSPLPTHIVVPISETPYPTHPFKCTERMCPMIACLDNLESQSLRMPPIDDCPPCPCMPLPIDEVR